MPGRTTSATFKEIKMTSSTRLNDIYKAVQGSVCIKDCSVGLIRYIEKAFSIMNVKIYAFNL
jgi:hypothetical protein